MTDFLPTNYEVPQPPTKYLKLKQGATRIRTLDRPILGYEGWTDNEDGSRKPIRRRMNQPFLISDVDPESIKHFWAMPVWNYEDACLQVFQISQRTIQK